ncbi:MAG: hypothetical protein WCJ56_01080 [bacterium]
MIQFLGYMIGLAGFILPAMWILRLWSNAQVIRTPLALAGLAAHIFVYSTLAIRSQTMLLIYSSVLLLLILANPFFSFIAERIMTNKLDDADIIQFKRIIERDPSNAAAHSALADIYRERTLFDEALVEYQLAIDLDPSHALGESSKLHSTRTEKEEYDTFLSNAKNRGRLAEIIARCSYRSRTNHSK